MSFLRPVASTALANRGSSNALTVVRLMIEISGKACASSGMVGPHISGEVAVRIGSCISRCSLTSDRRARVARLFGVYRESDGTSERALFVINEAGSADMFTEVSRGIDKWLWFV